MPVHDGSATLGRALDSLLHQTFPAWELVAVDDGSADGSHARLLDRARSEPRFRVLRSDTNRGPAAARNRAIRAARAPVLAYLDCDDEFYPDYLRHVDRLADRADVLVFAYDYVHDRDGPDAVVHTWDPTPQRHLFFERNLSTPLGVAHHRRLWEQAGGFHEGLWSAEDWDFWKRLARLGAEFLFLPMKSGLYHIRPGSLSHAPRAPERLRGLPEARRAAGEPLHGPTPGPAPARQVRRVLLATPGADLDARTPEAVAALDALDLLARVGFACHAFGVRAERSAHDSDTSHDSGGAHPNQASWGRVPITLARAPSASPGPRDPRDAWGVLAAFERLLAAFRPEAVLVHGVDDPLAHGLVRLARRRDLPVVLWLDRLLDRLHPILSDIDSCLVPSEFARRHHWHALGLDCRVLPPPLDPDRLPAGPREPHLVSFVAPRSDGEAPAIARMTEHLARLRPDIAVSSTAPEDARDPRDIFRTMRLLVAPRLTARAFDPIVAGALHHGIPVLASPCGALPEIIGDGGLVLELSDPAPVEPWVDAILRLWDDPALREQASLRARHRARAWHPERLAPAYAEFFRHLRPQPGPPLALKDAEPSTAS